MTCVEAWCDVIRTMQMSSSLREAGAQNFIARDFTNKKQEKEFDYEK